MKKIFKLVPPLYSWIRFLILLFFAAFFYLINQKIIAKVLVTLSVINIISISLNLLCQILDRKIYKYLNLEHPNDKRKRLNRERRQKNNTFKGKK